MTVNQVFQNSNTGTGTKQEQDLVESLTIEIIQMAGQNWIYIPRTIYDEDKILHEDPNSTFDKGFIVEMYLQNATGYGGQGYMLQKLGVEVNETIEILVSRKRFTQETQIKIPAEGDLLYHPVYKALFQINFVDQDMTPAFYQLAKNFVWMIKASFFKYSYENFNTGVKQIDKEFDPSTFIDPFGNNKDINNEANQVLDFTEENIFGDITEPDES